MALSQAKAKKSPTGAKYKQFRKKKQFELGSNPTLTKLADRKRKSVRVLGGNRKNKLLSAKTANVFDPKSKKFVQANILTIVDNPANRHFVRRNIITKGCVISTEKGKARVTSRPGQDSVVNAILIE
ncbi:30S ribosomal protein S8e [Candidatus Woesearchaeota archaeon]|nr:30S ribosomal protein S8e [Candidatus Woesearchaeota archaeon]